MFELTVGQQRGNRGRAMSNEWRHFDVLLMGVIATLVAVIVVTGSQLSKPVERTEADKRLDAYRYHTPEQQAAFRQATAPRTPEQKQQDDFESLAVYYSGAGARGYDHIEPGMSLAQVEKILGPGVESASSAHSKAVVWRYENNHDRLDDVIRATFVNDKLVSKARSLP